MKKWPGIPGSVRQDTKILLYQIRGVESSFVYKRLIERSSVHTLKTEQYIRLFFSEYVSYFCCLYVMTCTLVKGLIN